MIFKFLKMAVLSGWMFALTAPALAQEAVFEATVSSTTLSLNSPGQLTLTMRGDEIDADQVELPPIDGIEARYLGPFQQVSIVNGKSSVAKSFVYSIFPQRLGKLRIPSITARINGKDYTTQPIDLEVVEAAPQTDAGGAPATEGKIFAVLTLPKTEYYVGETIPASIRLFFNVELQNVGYPIFQNDGFIKGEYGYKQYQQVINGVRYKVVEFNTELTPTRTGDFTLGPATVEGSVLYKSADADPFGGRLDDDFFKGFFSTTTYERHPVSVNTDPVVVKILPLPEEGKPQGFSGAVGKFDFELTASPVDVRVGDPITLRMMIAGSGNIKSAELPAFADPQFKVYDPEVKEEENVKLKEQVIIPVSETIKAIPAVSFSYFDSELRQYKTITKGPIPITVHPAPAGSMPPAASPAGASDAPGAMAAPIQSEEFGRDIVFIKERLRVLKPVDFVLLKSGLFWLAIAGMILLTGCSIVLNAWLTRLGSDIRFARRWKAPREVRRGLKESEQALESGQPAPYYEALLKTLKEYLGNKLNVPSAGLTYISVERLLKEEGVEEEILRQIKVIFEAADLVRFGSVATGRSVMAQHFDQLKTIIDALERQLS